MFLIHEADDNGYVFSKGSGQAGEIGYLNVFLNSGYVLFLIYFFIKIIISFRPFVH